MRKLILLLLIAIAAWGGYRHFIEAETLVAPTAAVDASPKSDVTRVLSEPSQSFSCDGRTHCSQMRSCEEATYFLQNCPNTKMDGNGDGVPCEKQWCG
jgi:hypothetical protein